MSSSKKNIVSPESAALTIPEATANILLSQLPHLGVLTLNAAGEVAYANPAACNLLSLSFNQKQKKFSPLSDKIHALIKAELAHQNTSFTIEQRANNAQGSPRKLVITAVAETISDTHILYISDETTLQTSQDQLAQSERLLSAVLEASGDYICIKDGNNQWLKANQKLLDLFGLTDAHYQKASNNELLTKLTNKNLKHMMQYAEQTDEAAWALKKPAHHEAIILQNNGQEKTLSVTKTPSFGKTGERQHIAMFAQDITEQKLTASQLQNSTAILDVLISCDWLLHSADQWETVAKTVIQQCCLALRFTRGSILQFNTQDKSDSFSTCLSEWSTAGFISTSRNLERIDFSKPELHRWIAVLQNGNPVFTEIEHLPEEENRLLKQHDTKSLAIVPLFIKGKWWGNIIIERCYDGEKISSQEIGALMAISRSLGAAIQHEQSGNNLNLAEIAFNSADEGMMILDTNGAIVGINKGYSHITGYSEEESLGTTPLIFQPSQIDFWDALNTQGRWCSELVNFRKNGESYHERLTVTAVKNKDNDIVNYVGIFSDISEIKQSQESLHKLVNHDPLTGLPNRRLINELLQHAIKKAKRDNTEVAILFIDLDRFKSINDSLGHQYGDELLHEVSKRIQTSIRESDVAGRLGGDEFIVMMEAFSDRSQAEYKAKKILRALQTEFIIDEKELFVSASIGIAIFPDNGANVESMIKAADIAMYQVKNSGKNNYCFYAEEHSDQVIERFNIENQLRRAIERNQFEVYYQPQVDLESGNIIGAEALVRWLHPEMGIVSPDRFIPLAEETGLILQIGEWVLTQAAMTAKRWVGQHNSLKRISVNVSGIQIMRSNFTDTVYGVLIETNCAPNKLELEITESTVMKNTESVIETFNNIKGLGVGLAIDDFGTGYSSLSNLKRLPLDKLKIDRSFIKDLPDDLDDAAIANAIYAMASSLGFSVIAEGVETSEQESFLVKMGCSEAQGYRYSKPISSNDFNLLMEQDKCAIGDNHG